VMSATLFIGGILMSTLIATLAVAPFAAYQFHTSQQYGALANLVALPICDLLVMPAALATLLLMPLGLEAFPLWIAGLGIDAMTQIAFSVAKLPGAVIAVPAIPTVSFACMVAGGLWLLLWHTRGRLLGLPLIVLGLALAPTLTRPDILIGRDGRLVAARIDTGRLSSMPSTRGMFELSRWLEADGDGRAAKDVARGKYFACDGASCTTVLRGHRLAIPGHPAALADDCARASILILDRPRPKACTKPAVVIDPGAIRRGGAHALYLSRGEIRIETVAALRGVRPWSRPPPPPAPDRRRQLTAADGASSGRLSQFAAPAAFAERWVLPRPEDEDDDLNPIVAGRGHPFDADGTDVDGPDTTPD
jgi:competence protein ComEC